MNERICQERESEREREMRSWNCKNENEYPCVFDSLLLLVVAATTWLERKKKKERMI